MMERPVLFQGMVRTILLQICHPTATVFLTAVSCAAIFLSPFTYIGNYAGDSQVHLIYGLNASQGGFFEFNPGEKSPGVTSPGYMLFIASLFKMSPDILVPAVIKASNLLFWYGLAALVYLTAKRLLNDTRWALAATLTSGLLPGSVYNSTIGMENGIFAFVVFLWVYLAVRWSWFSTMREAGSSTRVELTMGIILGLSCWLRPEGFIVAAIALLYRVISSVGRREDLGPTFLRSAVFLGPFVILSAGLAYFHSSQTGFLLPASGLSRILMSNIADGSIPLGPIFVSTKFAVRLAQYFPLAVLGLLGSWALLRGVGARGDVRLNLGFLIVLFWTAFVLYSTILGTVHLARYIIFVMPGLILVATMAARWQWDIWRPDRQALLTYIPRGLLVGFAFALGGVFLLETNIRVHLDPQSSLWKSMIAPRETESFSNRLFEQLGQPEKLPISIALQEVQARYWLDDRFIVRSMDGRVDPVLLKHATKDGVDHVGYFRERRVDFLLDSPNYNRDPERWSLRRLNELEPGDSLTRDGLTFSRLPAGEPAPTPVVTSRPKSRWTDGADGATALNFFVQRLFRVDHGIPQ